MNVLTIVLRLLPYLTDAVEELMDLADVGDDDLSPEETLEQIEEIRLRVEHARDRFRDKVAERRARLHLDEPD
jgi:ClpP class serine protease